MTENNWMHDSRRTLPAVAVLAFILTSWILIGAVSSTTAATPEKDSAPASGTTVEPKLSGENPSVVDEDIAQKLNVIQEHLNTMSKRIANMEKLVWRAESRTGYIKSAGNTLTFLVTLILLSLVCMVVGFPLLYWWINLSRIRRLSGISEELTGALVITQDRQLKLEDALKQLEEEMNYLPAASNVDMKQLLDQAKASMSDAADHLETINSALKSVNKTDS